MDTGNVEQLDHGTTTHAARLHTLIQEELRSAHRVMDTPVIGPRGQQMSLADAQQHARMQQNAIDMDEARRSLRHRTVPRRTKLLSSLFLGVIDFPIMLWLTGSVFNVDWSTPLGLALLVSVVISVLGTGGSAWVLHHLGHNRRDEKTHGRRLDWADLSPGAKASLIGAGLLVALISVVMFLRVYTEGVLSGLAGLALLLAMLISFIMLLAAALVFSSAFRDGSPEQDDLAHYSAQVQAGLQRRRGHEDRAAQLNSELAMLLGPLNPPSRPGQEQAATSVDEPVGDTLTIGSADRDAAGRTTASVRGITSPPAERQSQ